MSDTTAAVCLWVAGVCFLAAQITLWYPLLRSGRRARAALRFGIPQDRVIRVLTVDFDRSFRACGWASHVLCGTWLAIVTTLPIASDRSTADGAPIIATIFFLVGLGGNALFLSAARQRQQKRWSGQLPGRTDGPAAGGHGDVLPQGTRPAHTPLWVLPVAVVIGLGHVFLLANWKVCLDDSPWVIALTIWFDLALIARSVLRRHPEVIRERLWHPTKMAEGLMGRNGGVRALWYIALGIPLLLVLRFTLLSLEVVVVEKSFRSSLPQYLSMGVDNSPQPDARIPVRVPGKILPVNVSERKIAFDVWRRLPRRIRSFSPHDVKYLALLFWDTKVVENAYGFPGAPITLPGGKTVNMNVGLVDSRAHNCTVRIVDLASGALLTASTFEAKMPGTVGSPVPNGMVEGTASVDLIASSIGKTVLGGR